MASNSSSPQGSKDQAKKKGRDTAEFKKVKDNMGHFEDSIKSIPDGVKSLKTKFIQNEPPWLPPHAEDITAHKLIVQALDRIKNDANEHGVFLRMLRGVTGATHIVTMFTVTEEEDNFPSPNNPNANGAAKHAIVVMNQQKPLKPLTTVISQQNQTRVSDSAFGSEYMSSSDTAEDIECPQSPPPGSLPGSFTNFQSGQQTRAVPPLLNSGAAINFIPEKESRADQPDGHVHGKSKTNTATTPVPTSGGEINFKAQQPMLEAAEYSPPSERLFTVGSLQSGISNAETETNELNEQMPSITKVPLPVQSEEELAEKFLSSHIINKLGQIDELEQQNKQLRRQLSVAIEEMEALRQEKDELSERFESYKKTAKEREEVIKNELKEKEKKLKECKANAEKEKKEMEAKHKEKCAELQREIEGLNKRIDDEERNTEFQTMKLQVELSKKKELLKDKEIVILTKENTIEQLEKKILEKEKEEIKKEKEEIKEREKKLLKENEELKEERDRLRSESLSRSLSSMQMCDLKREKDSDQAQQ